jgi:trk system potassium uptake protein TrkA
VVAINNEMEYYKLMPSLGIVVVRGPKMAAYHRPIAPIHSTRLLLERKYCGGEGTAFLRRVTVGGSLAGKRLKPLRRKGVRLLLLREDRPVVSPGPEERLEEGDLICVFATAAEAPAVERWFDGL